MSKPVLLRLDDLVLAAAVARRYFLEDRGRTEPVRGRPTLVTTAALAQELLAPTKG